MKKIIKIPLIVIGIIALIFFATGLIVDETTYEVSTTVNKPVEEVFAAFNDHTILQEWIPSVKSFKAIEEKEGKVGSRYKLIVDDNGKDFEMTETVTAFEVNKNVTLEFDAQGMYKTDAFTFASDGDNTTITNRSICKGTNYLLKCTFPYFKSVFKSTDQGALDNFKKYIEKTN